MFGRDELEKKAARKDREGGGEEEDRRGKAKGVKKR